MAPRFDDLTWESIRMISEESLPSWLRSPRINNPDSLDSIFYSYRVNEHGNISIPPRPRVSDKLSRRIKQMVIDEPLEAIAGQDDLELMPSDELDKFLSELKIKE